MPEPQGIIAEALAAAKRQQAEAMAAWRRSGGDEDQWPARESVGVNEESISNVSAAIRFFNRALRPKSETDLDLSDQAKTSGGEDIMANAVTVVRRRGPPVVVRIPAMQA